MKQYKARDKITQKMTRDGAIEVNEAKGTKMRISKRAREAALHKTPEQQTLQDAQTTQPSPGNPAPDISANAPPLSHESETEPEQDTKTAGQVLEHLDWGCTRKASKKAVRKAQADEKARDRTTRLRFEEWEKPPDYGTTHKNSLSRSVNEAGIFVHNKIHTVEKDNSAVEGAHKTEELAEKAARNSAQKLSNPLSRQIQKQKIKRQYAKAAKKGGAATSKQAAKKTAEITRKAAALAARHPAGVCIAIGALLLFIMASSSLSACGTFVSGMMNGILGTSYTSEDEDLITVENNYAALEAALQETIDNIERDHPGYDEYRYVLDSIGHNPHELASYLTALLQTYTPQSAQAEIERIFSLQYTLTLTEEVETRSRTETITDPETGETATKEVTYEYHILNIKLVNKPLAELAPQLLTPQQLEMFLVYLETRGNKPLIFGGGSPDESPSEDLSAAQLVNGIRPGNTAVADRARSQTGNTGGQPY